MRGNKILARVALSAVAALTVVAAGSATPALAAGTTATVAAAVSPASTTVALVSSRPSANYGAAGNVTATVKVVAPGTGVPTGSVDFYIDGGWYWSAPLDARGKALLPLSAIYPAYFPGTYSITAEYTGDAAYLPSSSLPVAQTLVGISTQPVSSIALNTKNQPVFSPNAFTMSSVNPVGCNVTVTNTSNVTVLLVYGTPGAWKRLPGSGGVIPPGASGGVGVGLSNFTGYFSAVGAANYVKIKCV